VNSISTYGGIMTRRGAWSVPWLPSAPTTGMTMSVGYVQDILFMVHLQTRPGLALVPCGVLCLVEVSQLDEAIYSGMPGARRYLQKGVFVMQPSSTWETREAAGASWKLGKT
jgi:hypothetical protein